MKYLPHSITLVMFSKEKHEPIKLQEIEIGAKFENLNKIWLISHNIPPDIINYVVKKNQYTRIAYTHSTSQTPQIQYSLTDPSRIRD